MLRSIRENAQGWIAWVAIGLIIIPFALWGIGDYFGVGGEANVARVDDTTITLQEFQQAYEDQRNRLRSMLGSDFASLDDETIRQDVLDSLIRQSVLQQSADDIGLRVSNEQLARQIQSMPIFQTNGQFSKETFEQVLRSQGIPAELFEAQMRQSLLTEQLNAAITSTAIVTKPELEKAIQLEKQRRDIGYLVLPWTQFKDDVTVDDAELEDYYEAHRQDFALPEQVSIEYLELSVDELASGLEVDEQELRQLYDDQTASFTTEEQRRASQILIDLSQIDSSLVAMTTGLSKARSLLRLLNQGADFGELAKVNSDDAETAEQGGDLGFFGKGDLDPAIEQALFALETPGLVDSAIQSPDGLHVLKLTEIKSAETRLFEEVRVELEEQYRQRQAEQIFFEKAEALANLAYEHPDTLTIAAEELGLQVKTSDFFGRNGGEGITAEPEIIEAAFSEDVLEQGYNSEAIELGDRHLVALRVSEHEESRVRALDEAREAVAEQLHAEKAQGKAKQVGQGIVTRLRQGEDTETIAKEFQVEWVNPGPVAREDIADVNSSILEAAFRLERPDADVDGPIVSGESLDSGDYAVIAVSAVQDGNLQAMEAQERLALKRQLRRSKSQETYESFVNGLRNQTEIAVFQEEFREAF